MDLKSLQPFPLAQPQLHELKRGLAGKAITEEQRNQQAATQFEALLAEQMTKAMWATVPKGELTGSFEEGLYRDMLSQAMGAELTKGQGLGIKQVVMKEMGLKKNVPTDTDKHLINDKM